MWQQWKLGSMQIPPVPPEYDPSRRGKLNQFKQSNHFNTASCKVDEDEGNCGEIAIELKERSGSS
jgi:hypothetical protein